MLDTQIGFDIGDETILKTHASVHGDRLHVGACLYKIVIVSKTVILCETTWKLLETFHDNGGIVVFTEEVPILSDAKKQCGTNIDGTNTYVPLMLDGRESVMLEIEDGIAYPSENTGYTVETLNGEIQIREKDSLTIDYASYSFDGTHYSDEMQVVHMQTDLYRNVQKGGNVDVYIRYKFYNQLQPKTKLTAAIEDTYCVNVFCNHTVVLSKKEGWYMDRGFTVYDISDEVVKGENILDVVYHLPPYQTNDVDGLFETEANRFFYPIEPEAVYIQGDFDVNVIEMTAKKPTHIVVKAEQFVLIPPKRKQI